MVDNGTAPYHTHADNLMAIAAYLNIRGYALVTRADAEELQERRIKDAIERGEHRESDDA